MKIFWLAAAGTLLYGGFVAYERWWDGDWSLVKNRVLSFVGENTAEIQEQALEKGNEVLENVKKEATEQAKTTISSFIGGVIESLGESIAHYGESVAGAPAVVDIPAARGPSFATPPPPVAVSARAGEPLTFVVNEAGQYTVTWGDNATSEGEVKEGENVLLEHTWTAPGDYVVILSTVSHTETFPIRIYE